MRRYDIVSGILLILPIIDFTLAAPVPVQEACRACADAVHIPEDMITVLGKRAKDPVDLEEFFHSMLGQQEESSASHASSSSAPSEPVHGSTSVVQAPAPDSASSTANPGHALMEPSSSSPTVSPVHEALHGPLLTPTSSEIGLDHGLAETHTPQPDPDFDLHHFTKSVWAQAPPPRPWTGPPRYNP